MRPGTSVLALKRALAIGLLVAGSGLGTQSLAAPVYVSNCSLGPETYQPGEWQSLDPYAVCTVALGDFHSFALFSTWWTEALGRSLSEILNTTYLEGDWEAPGAPPVVLVWLAPTSALPVPEPGSLGLLGVALLVQISCASRRSRAEAARRSGMARISALRAAQVRRPSS